MWPARIVKYLFDMESSAGHRSSLMRRAIGVVVGSAMLVIGLSSSSGAGAARTPNGARTGLIVASNVYLLAEPFDSEASLVEAMDRLNQPQPISVCCGGAWRVHFAALLERPTGDDTLNLEFRDVSSLDGPEPRSAVFSSAIATRSRQMTIFVNDFVITKEQGFAAGHEYEVSLWRPAGSDRNALAKGRFSLK
jgi:hypothetical protein